MSCNDVNMVSRQAAATAAGGGKAPVMPKATADSAQAHAFANCLQSSSHVAKQPATQATTTQHASTATGGGAATQAAQARTSDDAQATAVAGAAGGGPAAQASGGAGMLGMSPQGMMAQLTRLLEQLMEAVTQLTAMQAGATGGGPAQAPSGGTPAQKTVDAPQVSAPPKDVTPPKAVDAPQLAEGPKAVDATQLADAPKGFDAPKGLDAPKGIDTPKAVDAPQEAGSPKAVAAAGDVAQTSSPKGGEATSDAARFFTSQVENSLGTLGGIGSPAIAQAWSRVTDAGEREALQGRISELVNQRVGELSTQAGSVAGALGGGSASLTDATEQLAHLRLQLKAISDITRTIGLPAQGLTPAAQQQLAGALGGQVQQLEGAAQRLVQQAQSSGTPDTGAINQLIERSSELARAADAAGDASLKARLDAIPGTLVPAMQVERE